MSDIFKDFFIKDFFGNTLGQWSLFFLFLLLSIIIGRISYWIFRKVIRRFVNMTKNRLDDLIVDTIESPVVMGITLAGIWYSLRVLEWSPKFEKQIYAAYYLLIIFNVAWLLNRFLEALAREFLAPLVQKSDSDLDDMLLPILRRGLRVGVWLTAIIVGINNVGYDVGALLAGLGIGGLAFALAAQESLANLFGGLTIIADRPFALGDWLRIDGQVGQIQEIGLRSTRIRTVWDTELIIPNSKLVGNKIENLTKAIGRRIEIYIPLAYEHSSNDIEKAVGLIYETVKKHEGTLDDVSVLFRNFENFAFNIRVRYFVMKGLSSSLIRSDVNLKIMKVLEDNNLRLAKPIAAFQKNNLQYPTDYDF